MPDGKSKNFGHIISFDTESRRYGKGKTEYQEFYNADLYDGSEHIYCDTLEQFYIEVKGLLDEYKRITLIAHNIGYDIQILGLMDAVKRRELLGLEYQTAIISGVVYMKFGNGHKWIQILDTFNYFKTSLSDLGKQIGFKKVDESEYLLSPKEWNKQLKITGEKRVKRDTEILYKYFIKFISNPDFVFGISIASTSFKTFKAKFLNRVITIPQDHLEPALLSYRGGRTESYILNEKPVYAYSLDINSLYPYEMREHKYSYKYHRMINRINFDAIENNDYNYLFNVDYSFSDEFERLPVMVKRADGKLVQSYSAKNVWLTGNELLEMYKLDSDLLLAFRHGIEYHSDYLLREFVDYFYNKRLKSKGYERTHYKYILNTPYGKFGQHKAQTKLLWYDDLDLADTMFSDGRHRIKQNGKTYTFHDGFVTTKEEFEKERMYNPLIASEITANARLTNFHWQQKIGFNNVFYTDTDSFFSKRSWTTSDALGQLKVDKIKIDGDEYDKKGLFVFYGNKDYELTLDNGLKYSVLKGISKKAVKLTEQEKQEYKLTNDAYWVNQFSTLITNRKNGQVQVNKRLKKLNRKKDKMRYEKTDNGYKGLPFHSIEQA